MPSFWMRGAFSCRILPTQVSWGQNFKAAAGRRGVLKGRGIEKLEKEAGGQGGRPALSRQNLAPKRHSHDRRAKGRGRASVPLGAGNCRQVRAGVWPGRRDRGRGFAATKPCSLRPIASFVLGKRSSLPREPNRPLRPTSVRVRGEPLPRRLKSIAAAGSAQGARTVETSPRGFALTLLPFDIAERFQTLLPCASLRRGFFTSATPLRWGEEFSHFSNRLGFADAEELKIDSPFELRAPGAPIFACGTAGSGEVQRTSRAGDRGPGIAVDRRIARGCLRALHESSGARARRNAACARTGVIRRRHRLYVAGARRRVSGCWRIFAPTGDGVAPRHRELFGRVSTSQGRGAAARSIIDKLPFAPHPRIPLVKARVEHLQMQGGNAFRDYQLPEAALALKQGVRPFDPQAKMTFGAVAICDPAASRAGATAKFFSPRLARPCASRARSMRRSNFCAGTPGRTQVLPTPRSRHEDSGPRHGDAGVFDRAIVGRTLAITRETSDRARNREHIFLDDRCRAGRKR